MSEATSSHRFLEPRLSAVFFLELAARGAWFVVIAGHMKALGFTGTQISLVYATSAVGTILSPLLAGWIADRVMPAQRFASISHAIGGCLMLGVWMQTSFTGFWVLLGLYSVATAPTPALGNAIAFHHMKDPHRYAHLRLWGTVGWLLANWTVSGLLIQLNRVDPETNHLGIALLLGACLSFVQAIYLQTLPDTPPSKGSGTGFIREVFSLARGPLGILIAAGFLVGFMLPFFYNFTFLYFTSEHGLHFGDGSANLCITLGQFAELFLMLMIAGSIQRIGVKSMMLIGVLGLTFRGLIFAIGSPTWLAVAANTLHGLDYAFFFVVALIAAQRLSPPHLRASTQQVMMLATHGAGTLLGHLLSGWVLDQARLHNAEGYWELFFLVPVAISLPTLLLIALGFNRRDYEEICRDKPSPDLQAADPGHC